MAYTKQTWTSNETVITAARLNHMEDGIESVDQAVTTEASNRALADTELSGRIATLEAETTDTSLRVSGEPADAWVSGTVRDNLDADVGNYTAQVVIPCNDISAAEDGSVVNGMVRKSGRILYVNGEYPGRNWRICIYGRLSATNGSPSSARVPSWYEFGDYTGFEVGKRYGLKFIVLSGTAPEFSIGSGASSTYVTCRRRGEEPGSDDIYFPIYNGETAICTVQPETIAIALPAGTYENAQIYVKIYDVEEENRLAVLEADVASKSEQITALEAQVDTLESENETLAQQISDIISVIPKGYAGPGQVLTITDAARMNTHVLSLSFVPPLRTPTDEPTPNAIKPIPNYSGAEVRPSGKNLIRGGLASGTNTIYGVTYTFSDGNHIVISGTTTQTHADSGNKWIDGINKKAIYVKAGQSLTVSLKNANVTETPVLRVLFADLNGTAVANRDSTTLTWTITPSTDAVIARIRFRGLGVGTVYDIEGDVQIEYGTESTDYEAPQRSDTYSWNWALGQGPIYGGVIDGVAGTFTITHAGIVLTGEEAWEDGTSASAGFRARLPVSVVPSRPADYDSEICSHLKRVSAGSIGSLTTNGKNAFHVTSASLLFMYIDGINTVEELKTYLSEQYEANNPVVIVCEVEPTVYTVNPQQIRLLQGTNVLMSDNAQITVGYYKDLSSLIG